MGDFRLALILGGARSGKSRLALALALARGEPRLYIATGEAGDEEMAARISWHREERGPGWDTWEAPLELPEAIARAGSRYRVAVADCLTLWLSNLLMAGFSEAGVDGAFQEQVAAVAEANTPRILVSNEVGLGIVPDNPLARQFRDLAGRLHQRLAELADLAILADGSLGRLARHTVVDPGFSVDLARFGGAAFLDAHTLMAVSENKSFVVLRERDGADADANYRYFLESRDRFEEITRSRLSTVRARMMYVLSLAHDPSSGSLFTVSVPNRRTKRLVVSRFDRKDLTLSEEFLPALDAGAGLALRGEGRSLDELYVSGAAFDRGRLYALSATYGTLLTIDPAKRAVVAAYAVRGIDRPVGVAVMAAERKPASMAISRTANRKDPG